MKGIRIEVLEFIVVGLSSQLPCVDQTFGLSPVRLICAHLQGKRPEQSWPEARAHSDGGCSQSDPNTNSLVTCEAHSIIRRRQTTVSCKQLQSDDFELSVAKASHGA